MPPKCRPPESYFPSTSINTPLQGDELRDQNIEVVDQVINDDMDEDNVSDSNQEDCNNPPSLRQHTTHNKC
jgi:hypothetical protein